MAKRIKYKIGDIFNIPIDENGNKGYGKILLVDQKLIFVEFYALEPTMSERVISEIITLSPILSIWCVDRGVRSGEWGVIANIPIEGDVTLPLFWTEFPFDPDKLQLITMGKSVDEPTKRVLVNKDEIGDAQPFGVFGELAAAIRYKKELVKAGLYSDINDNGNV